MVQGFGKFREWFYGYEDQYVIIGGVACDLLMEEAGREFRTTRDLDMVLIVEAMSPEFVKKFWEYVKEAGYEHQNKNTGHAQFYRFSKPRDESWLYMIELFSRKPDDVFLTGESTLTPLPAGDDISSLSAILLDETYYEFLKNGRVVIDGIPVLDVKHLIPFKAKAYLDNLLHSQRGEHVDSKNIRKHKNDVFRLLLMMNENESSLTLPKNIKEEIEEFIEKMETEKIDMQVIGGGIFTKDHLLSRMKKLYDVE